MSKDKHFECPDLYFETTENFKVSPKNVKIKKNFREVWTTKKLYCLSSYVGGTCLAYDLHERPHYQFYPDERSAREKEADDAGIPYKFLSGPEVKIEDDIYHFGDETEEFQQNVAPLIKADLDLDKLTDMLIQREKDQQMNKSGIPKDRGTGNITISVGYSSQNLKFDGTVTVPRCTQGITNYDAHHFIFLTKIFYNVYRKHITKSPEIIDMNRLQEWGDRIIELAKQTSEDKKTNKGKKKNGKFELKHHTNMKVDRNQNPRNIFENMTYALTYLGGAKKSELTCHVDSFNEVRDGFNMAMAVYIHHYHSKSKQWVRIAIIGYFRRVVSEYYNRLNNQKYLYKNLGFYCKNLGSRLQYCLENAITPNDNHNVCLEYQYKLPFVDKCAFYSIFVSAIDNLIYSEKVTRENTVYLQDLIEIITPIGWLNTGVKFYELLNEWTISGIPSGNKTVVIIQELVNRNGSLTSGHGPRFMPFCNKDIPLISIFSTNKILYQAIKIANNSREFKYTEVMSILSDGYYYSDLGSQHVLSICTLLGLITNVSYLSHATIAKGTKTANMYLNEFGLNYSAMNGIYQKIADNFFDRHTYMAENAGCEYLRDMKRDIYHYSLDQYNKSIKKRKGKHRPRHPDSFHYKQWIYRLENNKIMKYRYLCDNKTESMNYKLSSIAEKKNTLWMKQKNISETNPEIKFVVTNKSKSKSKSRGKSKSKSSSNATTKKPRKKSLTEKTSTTKAAEVKPATPVSTKVDHPTKKAKVEKNSPKVTEEDSSSIIRTTDDVICENEIETFVETPSMIMKLELSDTSSESESEHEAQIVIDEIYPKPIIQFHKVQLEVFDGANDYTYDDFDKVNFKKYMTRCTGYDQSVVSINVNQWIQKIVGNRFARFGKHRPKKKIPLLEPKRLVVEEYGDVFTCIIHGEDDHVVHITNWLVYNNGFVGYYDCTINGIERCVAFYKTIHDSIKAAQIYALTELAMQKENKDALLPEWIMNYYNRRKNYLTKYPPKDNPKFKGIVFNQNLNQTTKFFAYLDLNQEPVCLYVPIDDTTDRRKPWQKWSFYEIED